LIIVKNTITNLSRGYGFIEFEHKSDFLSAYKYGDGKRIDGKRVIVDFERGRTMLKWRPRRLGGGLGDTRRSKSEDLKKNNEDLIGGDKRGKSRERRSNS